MVLEISSSGQPVAAYPSLQYQVKPAFRSGNMIPMNMETEVGYIGGQPVFDTIPMDSRCAGSYGGRW